jgi:DNA-binding LacI/PurR family transcriptional regulator
MSSTDHPKEPNGTAAPSSKETHTESLTVRGESFPQFDENVTSMDKTKRHRQKKLKSREPIGLKKLAAYLGLDPATVSVVLNDVPGRSIPQATRDRIKAAAKKFNYQPSLLARSLRNRRTFTIGVLVPELGDGYHTRVMNGIGDHLMESGYFYFTAHHRHRKNLIEEYCQMLLGRGAEALITIDTALEHNFSVPVAAIAGHRAIIGVTNIALDHRFAAQLTLTHLYSLGHRDIAFIRGQPFSSDSAERWNCIVAAANNIGITIQPERVAQLDRDISSPELGYPVVQQLLSNGLNFTALVAFNDMSALGAIRALQDFGLSVPGDVSVIGFDDINVAAFSNPRLTTIRQPLSTMGRIAAQCVLSRLNGSEPFRKLILVEPELAIRESTRAIDGNVRAETRRKS